jgi:hypothetical protein
MSVDLWIAPCEVGGIEAATSSFPEGSMTIATGALLIVSLLGMLAVTQAYAEVPTAADFAACNTKAAEDVKADAASASPRAPLPKDATELPSDTRTQPRDPAGRTLSSEKDPQIEGLAADRANDKVYVAAYRACMRQRGF